MGNFSRDTFTETNILTNLLDLGAPVADPRQYVGVRLQQGVPILDADWNELEDLRRLELMALVRFFIGNGVPAGTQGFRITTSPNANSFTIAGGVILMDGHMVINGSLTSYTAQPNAAGLPALTTPGADRVDLVYLDTFEIETNGIAGDPRLVNRLIGIETAVRIERKWVVRVQENASDLSVVPKVAGHKYTALARLMRRGGNALIAADMIIDLRKTGITLAENIKVPIFIQLGADTIDKARFAEMLRALRGSLFARLQIGELPHDSGTVANENILLLALQDLMGRAQAGEVQTVAGNLNNQDALAFLQGLYDEQKAFLGVLNSVGNVGNVADAFILAYTKRLDGSAPELIKGLKLSLDNQDLVGAVLAQEEINTFLSEPVDVLPEGSVDVIYTTVNPVAPMAADAPFVFSFDIVSHVTSTRANEEFEILVNQTAASWQFSVSQNTVLLTNLTGMATITVTVTPNDDLAELQSTLTVTARAKRKPTIESPQPGINLQIGVTPPVGNFFFYADSAGLDVEGRIPIRQPHLTRVQGRNLLYRVRNDNLTQIRRYQIVHSINPVGDTTGWSPLPASAVTSNTTLNPNTTVDALLRVDGPKPPGPPPAPPIGTTGEVVASATLIEIDGVPVVGGASMEVRLNFVVVA